MTQKPLESRKEYRKQNLFFFCDIGKNYGRFRYGILGVPLELGSIIRWFDSREDAEAFFYECLEKYKHLLYEYEPFLGNEAIIKERIYSAGVICVETGEAFESCDMAAFLKKNDGILSLKPNERKLWLGFHWMFVYPEIPEMLLANVANHYSVDVRNLAKHIRAGFCIFDAINHSKKIDTRNYRKCKVFCKELNRTFQSIKEAESYFKKSGLSRAINKCVPWHGLHFKRV